MDSANGLSVQWKVEGETFVFVADVDPPTLHLPDGRHVELSLRGWRRLRDVLQLCPGDLCPGDVVLEVPARKPTPGPGRRGQAWSDEEDDRVKAAFLAGDDVTDIARALERTRGAVMARLVHLGVMEAETAGLRYPPSPRARPEVSGG